MKNLKRLTFVEQKKINGGKIPWPIPIGLGGILLVIDAARAYMEGIEEAYNEKNPPKEN